MTITNEVANKFIKILAGIKLDTSYMYATDSHDSPIGYSELPVTWLGRLFSFKNTDPAFLEAVKKLVEIFNAASFQDISSLKDILIISDQLLSRIKKIQNSQLLSDAYYAIEKSIVKVFFKCIKKSDQSINQIIKISAKSPWKGVLSTYYHFISEEDRILGHRGFIYKNTLYVDAELIRKNIPENFESIKSFIKTHAKIEYLSLHKSAHTISRDSLEKATEMNLFVELLDATINPFLCRCKASSNRIETVTLNPAIILLSERLQNSTEKTLALDVSSAMVKKVLENLVSLDTFKITQKDAIELMQIANGLDLTTLKIRCEIYIIFQCVQMEDNAYAQTLFSDFEILKKLILHSKDIIRQFQTQFNLNQNAIDIKIWNHFYKILVKTWSKTSVSLARLLTEFHGYEILRPMVMKHLTLSDNIESFNQDLLIDQLSIDAIDEIFIQNLGRTIEKHGIKHVYFQGHDVSRPIPRYIFNHKKMLEPDYFKLYLSLHKKPLFYKWSLKGEVENVALSAALILYSEPLKKWVEGTFDTDNELILNSLLKESAKRAFNKLSQYIEHLETLEFDAIEDALEIREVALSLQFHELVQKCDFYLKVQSIRSDIKNKNHGKYTTIESLQDLVKFEAAVVSEKFCKRRDFDQFFDACFFKLWNSSSETVDKFLKSFSSNEGTTQRIKRFHDLGHTCSRTLYIEDSKLQSSNIMTTLTEIVKRMEETEEALCPKRIVFHGSVQSIGREVLSLPEMQHPDNVQLLLSVSRKPFVCFCEDGKYNFLLHPVFVLQSELIRKAYLSCMREKNENIIRLPSLTYQSLLLVNDNIENLAKIELDGSNIAEMLFLSNYLSLSPVFDYCCKYIKNLLKEIENLNDSDSFNLVVAIMKYKEILWPSIVEICEKKIKDYIFGQYGLIPKHLDSLFQNEVYLDSLTLNVLKSKEQEFALLFKMQNQLKHVTFKAIELSDAEQWSKRTYGLRNLKRLKTLSFAGCKTLPDIVACNIPHESLEILDLTGCKSLTSVIAIDLKRLKNLKTLLISGCSFDHQEKIEIKNALPKETLIIEN